MNNLQRNSLFPIAVEGVGTLLSALQKMDDECAGDWYTELDLYQAAEGTNPIPVMRGWHVEDWSPGVFWELDDQWVFTPDYQERS